MTERQLRWWWGHYSKELFYDKIPKPREIRFTQRVHPMIAHTWTGRTRDLTDDSVSWSVERVWLNPRIAWADRLVQQAIIHEQQHVYSHIENGNFIHGHGKKFAALLPNRAAEELLRLTL